MSIQGSAITNRNTVEPQLRGGERSTEKERRLEKMKYIWFWEFCPEDMDKAIEKSEKRTKDVEKNPEKYATTLYPSHSLGGQTKGFAIVESTPEQCRESIMYYLPELKVKFVPLFEASKLIEEYRKL